MRSAKWIVAMLLLAGVSLTAQESKPSKQSADCGDSLDSALELSGFNDSVKSMPVMVRQQVRQQAKLNKDLPDAAKEKLISLVTAAFDEEKIIESMKHKLSADCNPEMLNAAVVRLQGPLAQKARQQEAIAMTEEGQKAAPEYFRSLQKNAPDPDRVTLLERMDKDLNITDTTLNMVVAMTAGLAAGFGGDAGTPSELEGLKEQYRPQIHNSMIANQLFTYRNLTDDELDKYITIYETPEMRRLTEQLSNGMTEVFSERMQLMAKDFRKYLDENPPAKEPAPAAKAPAPKSKTTTKAPSK